MATIQRMKKALLCLSALACLSLQSCVLINIQVPLDTDLQDTDLGDKTGESSFQSVLGLVMWGNAGTQAAAMDGGITTLKHADQQIFSVLWGVYYRQTTVVYGN
ncbi:MAG: hypothetical protein ACI9SE_001115 [Neolewinella sp.]